MLIDAEYHEMQPAIHALALITQSSHNKGDCINVWNNQQAYLRVEAYSLSSIFLSRKQMRLINAISR